MPKATLATACTMLADMDDADELTRRYRAIVARIDRYPVTDPAMRAWALAEIERIYRADLRVGAITRGWDGTFGWRGRSSKVLEENFEACVRMKPLQPVPYPATGSDRSSLHRAYADVWGKVLADF